MENLIKYLKKIEVAETMLKNSYYLSLISLKNIKNKRKIEECNEIVISDKRIILDSEIKKQYLKYYNGIKLFDNRDIYCFESKESKKSPFLNIVNSSDRVVEIFNKETENENELPVKSKHVRQIVLEEHLEDIKGRKISNRLENPHYFFTNKYIEKSRPSQVRH